MITDWKDQRSIIATLIARLESEVKEACPGDHELVQHRDGRPPWCKRCKRMRNGMDKDQMIMGRRNDHG